MALYKLSDPIEIEVTGSDYYDYKLYDNDNPSVVLYEGRVYPYPSTIATTKKSYIILNDVVENYVTYDSFNPNTSGRVMLYSFMKNFKIVITGYVAGVAGTPSTQYFSAEMAWNRIGDDSDAQEIMSATYERTVSGKMQSINPDNDLIITLKEQNNESHSTPRIFYLYLYRNDVLRDTASVSWSTLDPYARISYQFTPSAVFSGMTADDTHIYVSEINPAFGGGSAPYPKYGWKLTFDNCSLGKYRLWYFNRRGGLEFIESNEASKLNTTNVFNDYKKNYRSFNGSSMTGDVSTTSNTRTSVTTSETYNFVTPLLSDFEHSVFEEVISSPKMWITHRDWSHFGNSQTYKAVNVVDTNYNELTYKTNRFVNRTIQLKTSTDSKRR